MAFSGKGRRQKYRGKFFRKARAGDTPSDGENVGVVVLPGQAGCIAVVAQSRPNARDLVRRDAHTQPRPTYEDSDLAPPTRNRLSHLPGNVRVVNGLRVDRSAVLQRVALSLQESFEVLF